MTALVTGGTGFLGTSLTRRLLADGVPVRVLARSPARAQPLAELGADIVVGDITSWAAVHTAADGVQVIYHLAGPLLVPGIPGIEYRQTHVLGTEVLLDCCDHASALERLVYCSTTGVLGVTGDQPAAEDTPYQPTNVYERAKAEAELAVRCSQWDGLPAVIARPGLVYGPGDLHLLPFFLAILRHRFLPIGRGQTRLHPIYIDDVTEALVRCGRASAAVGECFHLAGADPVTVGALAAEIARAEGTRLPPGHIPAPTARAVAGLAEWLPPDLKRRFPLTRGRLDFLTHSRVYDVTKAARLLGFTAPTDLPTGVARTVAWYRQRGYLPPDPAARTGLREGVSRCVSGIMS